jgi:serine protease Do
MKNYIKLLSAGILGGIVSFGLFKFSDQGKPINYNQAPVRQVSRLDNNATNINFVTAASLSTPAVVHIYAEESDKLVTERRNRTRRQDPYGFSLEDFFGGDFFGRDNYQQAGSGSGVIISKQGYIVTNNHVVGYADDVTVTTVDGKKYKATKVGTDPSSDLAVLKITADNLTTLEYGDSDAIKVGEWVLAVGNPFNYLTSTVTAGIISAKARSLDIIKEDKKIESFLQTDAAVNPGNSGGALVDLNGKLIGINTAIATPTGSYAGYSFAIPSNLVKVIVEKIIKFGSLERVDFGIGGYDLDTDLVKEFGLSVKEGFYVDQVQTRSSAKLAGLLPGDVIVKLADSKIKTYDDIEKVLSTMSVGEKIDVTVNRNGKELKISTLLRKQI